MWTHGTWCWIDPPRDTAEVVVLKCHQLVSIGIPAESLDLKSPLFLTMCNDALWDCQTLLCNWVTIKIVLGPGYIMKHGMECVRIKIELEL